MQDLNNKITGDTLTAAEFNEPMSEIQNVIENLGQTLSAADLNQLGKAIAGYAANGSFYADGGAADAYVLSPIGLKQAPPAYADGMRASFKPANTNTGASTVNVAGLGVKSIKTSTGADPSAGAIFTGSVTKIRFDFANDWFVLESVAGLRIGASDSALQQGGVDVVPFNAGGAIRSLESGTCTQAAGALTFTLNPTVHAMRSVTLTDGVPTVTKVNSAITLVLPSGGTLGFPTTVQGRIVVALMGNGELAICALAGGLQLNEENLISTMAISASSTTNNVWYSTTARTNQPYKIVQVVDAVNTAGAWADPVLVQGAGGNAVRNLSSSEWTDVVGSRAKATTYYNTTDKKIEVSVNATNTVAAKIRATVTQNGTAIIIEGNDGPIGYNLSVYFSVPPGAAYEITNTAGTMTISRWVELR